MFDRGARESLTIRDSERVSRQHQRRGLVARLTGFFVGFLGFARFLAFATRVITSFPRRWRHFESAQNRLQAVVRSVPTATVGAGELR